MHEPIHNATAGQLRAGQLFRPHADHPSLWRMIVRVPGEVKVRHVLTDPGRKTGPLGRDCIMNLRTPIYAYPPFTQVEEIIR